jgi:hypothetical protein
MNRYASSAAFKQALETRLRASSSTGVDFARRRQLLVSSGCSAPRPSMTSSVGWAPSPNGSSPFSMTSADAAAWTPFTVAAPRWILRKKLRHVHPIDHNRRWTTVLGQLLPGEISKLPASRTSTQAAPKE